MFLLLKLDEVSRELLERSAQVAMTTPSEQLRHMLTNKLGWGISVTDLSQLLQALQNEGLDTDIAILCIRINRSPNEGGNETIN